MSVDKITEEEKSKKIAFLGLVEKALLPPEQELTPNELQKIRSVDAAGQKAIQETEYPPFGKQEKMDNHISKEPTPEAPRTEGIAAKSSISSRSLSQSIFDLSSRKKTSRPVSVANEQAGAELLQEAQDIVKAADEPVENLKDLGPLDTDQWDEYTADATETLQELSDANKTLSKAIATRRFPHVAKEILDLGLHTEKMKTEELERYKLEGDGHKNEIKKLLELGKHLDALPPGQPMHNLKEAILDKLTGSKREEMEQCLKEAFPGGLLDITKEQVAGAKVWANEMMSKHRADMTDLLTTKISVVIHFLQMLTQVMQNALRLDERLHGTIIRNSGTR
jgi:hypothetical protein